MNILVIVFLGLRHGIKNHATFWAIPIQNVENHRPAASHWQIYHIMLYQVHQPAESDWQTWTHNVVSSTPPNERDSNSR